MKDKIVLFFVSVLLVAGCKNTSCDSDKNNSLSVCKDTNCNENKKQTINSDYTCKLTTPELQKRKATVLESLRLQILEKKELSNGYAFRFTGSDKMIDELTEFIKSERECCGFFDFNLRITGDTSSVWFEITGEKEAKDFIKTELEL